MSDTSKPTYKLGLDPNFNGYGGKAESLAEHQRYVDNMNFALEAIGRAKGWGNNPRWDLLFEAGLKALLSEK